MDGIPLFGTMMRLRGRAEAWMRVRLWAQVLVALVLGVAAGIALGPDAGWVGRERAEQIGAWLALPGKVFLGLIAMVLVPLVVASIVQGLVGAASGAELRAIGGRFALFVLLTTGVAAGLGVLLAVQLQPGSYVELPEPVAAAARDELARKETDPSRAGAPAGPRALAAASEEEGEGFSIADYLGELLPTDPQATIAERDMLGIVILAMLIGLAIRSADPARVRVVVDWLDGILQVSMVFVQWAMFLVPWAVFGMMADLMARVGPETLFGMLAYVGTVLLGLLLLLCMYVAIVLLLARRSPGPFLQAIAPVQLLAFSTSSSAAVMPLSIETAHGRLGVPKNVASLVIPLGATVNMAGTALYQSVAVLFLTQMMDVPLTGPQLAVVVVTLVMSSIGAPGTPGVSIVILANVVEGIGVPSVGLVLILGVDRLLDMARTVANVTGDLAACVLLAGSAPAEPSPLPPAAPTP